MAVAPDIHPAVSAPVADVQAPATPESTAPLVDAESGAVTLAGAVTEASPANGYTVRGMADSYLLTFQPTDPVDDASWRLSFLDGRGRMLRSVDLSPGTNLLSIELGSTGVARARTFQVVVSLSSPWPDAPGPGALHYVIGLRSDAAPAGDPSGAAAGTDPQVTTLPDDVLEQWFLSYERTLTQQASHPASPSTPAPWGGSSEVETGSYGGHVAPATGGMRWHPEWDSSPDLGEEPTPDRRDADALADLGGRAGSDPGDVAPTAAADLARGLVDAPGGPAAAGPELYRLAAWGRGPDAEGEAAMPEDPERPGGRGSHLRMRAMAERDRPPLNRAALLATSAALIVPNLTVLAWSRRSDLLRFRRGHGRPAGAGTEPE